MPATQTTTGAETFQGFDERRYQLRCVECKETTSPPPDNRPQYSWTFALEGTRDEENGGEIKRRCWTSQIWNDTPGKESHLVILARALCGPQVTQAQFEALDYPDLVGLTGNALVKLDQKGWPTIDKESFRPVGNAAPRNQAPLPQAAAPTPAQTQLPNKPTRPVLPRPAAANIASEEQREKIRQLAEKGKLDAASLDAWIAESYAGKTLATITPEEATALLEALSVPF